MRPLFLRTPHRIKVLTIFYTIFFQNIKKKYNIRSLVCKGAYKLAECRAFTARLRRGSRAFLFIIITKRVCTARHVYRCPISATKVSRDKVKQDKVVRDKLYCVHSKYRNSHSRLSSPTIETLSSNTSSHVTQTNVCTMRGLNLRPLA
jgi:hypothetical protein